MVTETSDGRMVVIREHAAKSWNAVRQAKDATKEAKRAWGMLKGRLSPFMFASTPTEK